MKQLLPVLICFLSLAGAALAQPGPRPGMPPVFKIVTGTDPAKGFILFRQTVYKTVAVQVPVLVNENGKEITKLVTEHRTTAEDVLTQIDATLSSIITPDGKQLPIEEVWKRLKGNSVVVVSADASTPSAMYLRAVAAETLIIVPGSKLKKVADPEQ